MNSNRSPMIERVKRETSRPSYLGTALRAGIVIGMMGLATAYALNRVPKTIHEPAINEHPHNYQGGWMPHVVESGETVDGILFGTYGLGGYKPCAREDVLGYSRNSGDARIFPNDTLWVPADMPQHPVGARK